MSENTKIGWTEATWNPVAGCRWASPGCDHCYAVTMTRRLEAMGQAKYNGLTTAKHFNGKVYLAEEHLQIPLKRKKPTMYFVNSMSDLFYEAVDHLYICRVFATMYECHWHTFQVLTKRPEFTSALVSQEAMPDVVGLAAWHALNDRNPEKAALVTESEIAADVRDMWPLPNVWLGTSVENRDALHRIDTLRSVPAAVRFLSLEPLLEDLGPLDLTGIDWVIVGCESGPGRRPMDRSWASSIAEQCAAANVACFVKQIEVDGKVDTNLRRFPPGLRLRQFPTAQSEVPA